MTMETITAATPAAPLERAVWRAEIIETVKLAWPMALTQLGQIAMMTTDSHSSGGWATTPSRPSAWHT
jgi:Na+-driven multidrug efflux pump